VTSKVRPVRVIRSYLGANSGPNTQRTHIFYDRREDIVTNLRVHSIPSIMDFFDYYLDDATAPVRDAQCTGDAFAYGTSGRFVTSAIPSTDPAIGGTRRSPARG